MQSSQIAMNLELLQSGDEAGLCYFMSLLGEPLRYFAYRIIRDKEVAEEIVSESFFKLWQGRDKAVSLPSIKSFLYITIRNACYDHTGSSYKRKTILNEELFTDRVNENRDILAGIIQVELIEQIVLELEKLPRQQADIFRMSFLEGRETREICEDLNTTAGNVYFARSKVLSCLREIFKEKEISFYLSFAFFMLVN